MHIKNWDIFKAQADSRNCNIQWIDIHNCYYLKVIDGPFELSHTIKKTGNSAQTDFETNYKDEGNTTFTDAAGSLKISTTPFADKRIGVNKLYSRVEGITYSLTTGSNTLSYAVPWPQCKIDGIEIINGESLDTVDLNVKDDASGTYSGVPNYQLNQFGYTVGVAKDYYLRQSKYDADLYQDMVIEIAYNSQSAKDVIINYLIHEVK